MKNSLNIIISILLLSSCINNTKREYLLTPKKEIQIVLDSFVQKHINKHYTIYELYIDKLAPDNYNLILYAGDKSLTQNENEHYKQQALNYVVSHGIKIEIYSGVEHFFNNSSHKKMNNLQKGNRNESAFLAIKDSCGYLHTYDIETGGYPFIPLPLENKEDTFSPPVLE